MEKEEQKKNKTKWPILNHPVPLQQPIIKSPTTLRNLAKGKYVSLWYWTPTGIESTRFSFINSDTQTYFCQRQSREHLPHSHCFWKRIQHSNSWFQTTFQQLPNHHSPPNWSNGLSPMAKEWILMMSHFWDNILDHPHHSSGIPEEK